MAKCIIKHDSTICYLQDAQLTYDKDRLKVKGWKHIYHANVNKKSVAAVALVISDKINFRTKKITERDIT